MQCKPNSHQAFKPTLEDTRTVTSGSVSTKKDAILNDSDKWHYLHFIRTKRTNKNTKLANLESENSSSKE